MLTAFGRSTGVYCRHVETVNADVCTRPILRFIFYPMFPEIIVRSVRICYLVYVCCVRIDTERKKGLDYKGSEVTEKNRTHGRQKYVPTLDRLTDGVQWYGQPVSVICNASMIIRQNLDFS